MRNRVLSSVILVTLLCLGGCSVPLFEDDQSKLVEVRVENSDDSPHTIHTIVEKDGSIISWTSHRLNATEKGRYVSKDVNRSWGNTTGHYTVYMRLDQNTTWKDVNTSDSGCYGFYYHVDPESSQGYPNRLGKYPRTVLQEQVGCSNFEF